MSTVIDNIQGKRVDNHRPWPRFTVDAEAWRQAGGELAEGRATLLGLWGDAGASCSVHMAIMDDDTNKIAVLSLECPDETFPSIGALGPDGGGVPSVEERARVRTQRFR